MTVHILQRQNKVEGMPWRRSVAKLVAALNDPNLIAVVLFCLIALLVTAGGLRWELERPTHATFGAAPLCFVNVCFAF